MQIQTVVAGIVLTVVCALLIKELLRYLLLERTTFPRHIHIAIDQTLRFGNWLTPWFLLKMWGVIPTPTITNEPPAAGDFQRFAQIFSDKLGTREQCRLVSPKGKHTIITRLPDGIFVMLAITPGYPQHCRTVINTVAGFAMEVWEENSRPDSRDTYGGHHAYSVLLELPVSLVAKMLDCRNSDCAICASLGEARP